MIATRRRGPGGPSPYRQRDAPRVVFCFHAVLIGWVFFRANTIADALFVLRHLPLIDVSFLIGVPTVSRGDFLLCLPALAVDVAADTLHTFRPEGSQRLTRSGGLLLNVALLGLDYEILGYDLIIGNERWKDRQYYPRLGVPSDPTLPRPHRRRHEPRPHGEAAAAAPHRLVAMTVALLLLQIPERLADR